MIIGISGKKQSGKDTVANMIQYLGQKEDACFSDYSDYLFWKSNPRDYPESIFFWQKKQFAAKVKQIVCLLIGCTLEQLEDGDFKEKELGEEWRIWTFMDRKSNIRIPTYYYSIYASKEEAEDFLRKNMMHHLSVTSEFLTPRKLLQLIGTEAGRNLIHPNIWVNATMADYKPLSSIQGVVMDLSDGSKHFEKADSPIPWEMPNWIITDVRFPNEAEAIKAKGGIVIRVERSFLQSTDTHPSETSLDNYQHFDTTIMNNGSLNQLLEMVGTTLSHYKIIK